MCPALLGRLLKVPAGRFMRLRIAVHQGESWLLADAERMVDFLDVHQGAIPGSPDELVDAKQTLINLARKSRSHRVQTELAPAEGSTARVGPQYVSQVAEFARGHWRPGVAAKRSESLARCIRALQTLPS